MRRFPLSLRPSPLPYTDQGAPLDPLCRALRHRASLLWHRALGAKASHPDRAGRRVEGSCIGFWKSKANSTFCKVVKQKGETFWQPLQPWFVKETAVFLCKGTKLQNSAKPNSRTVCRFPPWYAFWPLIPAVRGFGLGLLGGQGFIGAKASLDPLCRALWHRASFWHRKSHLLCKRLVPKLQNSAFAEFWDSMPVFYGGILYWLLEKQGKLYFLQSSQTKGRDVLAAFATLVCQRNCVFLCKDTKLQRATLFVAVCLVTQSFGFLAKGSGQPGKNSVRVFVFVLLR